MCASEAGFDATGGSESGAMESGAMESGATETATQCADMDGDGHGASPCGDDCDDTDARRYPGNREVCDGEGRDEDCNACTVSEQLPDGRGGDGDRDEDGFPSRACFNRLSGEAMPVCTGVAAPDGGATVARVKVDAVMREVRGADCDDLAATRSPVASEVCDAARLDENCDGSGNEGCTCETGASRGCAGPGDAPLSGARDGDAGLH